MEGTHMAKVNLNGIFPPIPTPFINGKVAYQQLAANVEKWSKTGIRGFVVLGSNGEYVYLSEEEKRNVIGTVAKSAPKDLVVIAGSGCESTEATLKLTCNSASLGAHAALVVTPHYYSNQMTGKALMKHFTFIADRSPIPIILYNVPKFTHITLTPDLVSALSEHPNIIGIKDSTGNIHLLSEFLNQVGKHFDVLVGTAGVWFAGLTLGCTGGILALANITPENCVKIFELLKKDEFEKARTLQLKMIPVNKTITTTYGISGLKAAMDMLGYYGGDPRHPLLPPSEKEKSEIKEILQKADILPG